MVKMSLNDLDMGLTEMEQKELEAAESLQPAFDEDCPEMTTDKLLQFKRISNNEHVRKTVSLRLSPKT